MEKQCPQFYGWAIQGCPSGSGSPSCHPAWCHHGTVGDGGFLLFQGRKTCFFSNQVGETPQKSLKHIKVQVGPSFQTRWGVQKDSWHNPNFVVPKLVLAAWLHFWNRSAHCWATEQSGRPFRFTIKTYGIHEIPRFEMAYWTNLNVQRSKKPFECRQYSPTSIGDISSPCGYWQPQAPWQ